MDIQLINTNTCEPMPEIYTDIWHCNSTVRYPLRLASRFYHRLRTDLYRVFTLELFLAAMATLLMRVTSTRLSSAASRRVTPVVSYTSKLHSLVTILAVLLTFTV